MPGAGTGDAAGTGAAAGVGITPARQRVVQARDLSLRYRSTGSPSQFVALRGVNLDLDAGEILGIVGESGAGKSSLMIAIAGLAGTGRPGEGIPEISGGSLNVLDVKLRGIGRRRRDRLTLQVGFLRQDAAERLSPMLTAAENVAEPIYLRDHRFSQREATAAVATIVDEVRLPLSVMNKLPHELSSGQRQRVALARAMILEPQLLVADEPTRGVDAAVRDGVLEALRDLQRHRGLSAVVVSSDLTVVERIADRVAAMQGGMVVGLGALDEMLRDAEHPYVAGLARARRLASTFGAHPVL
jgi:peptide/nickel transport system ATP-binding protein